MLDTALRAIICGHPIKVCLQMDKIVEIFDVIDKFHFTKGGYAEAEDHLLKFADCYAELNAEEAEFLRSQFDEKDRLGWFRVASSLFRHSFPKAGTEQKNKLCKIFFALYSFDNLEFGYDSIMDVISISSLIKPHIGMAKKNWGVYRRLTSNSLARNNLEAKIFRLR
jgi:hypothetical protein